MPLLYKLIMDKLGEKCWLSLAPNHMYIKAWNKRAGWYNIELTCADFPTDAWLTASGYIHLDAIRNGIYMDTLSVQQSIALCLTDIVRIILQSRITTLYNEMPVSASILVHVSLSYTTEFINLGIEKCRLICI